jgi:hypothetical protein
VRSVFLPHHAPPLLVITALAMGCEPAPREHSVATSTDGTIVTPKVTVPPGTKPNARAFASLGDPKRAAELLGRSAVPVLAPANVELEQPTFIVGPEYYSLTGRLSGATITISGTRAARRYPNIAPVTGDRVLRGTRGFVSVNEGIRIASWNENGIAYSVDVECAPPTDERCSNDRFVIDLVEHLAFAGGASR